MSDIDSIIKIDNNKFRKYFDVMTITTKRDSINSMDN